MIVTDVCITHKVPPVHTVDEILASSPLSGLQRVSGGGGDRQVALVRLAERFADLDDAPAGSLVVLSRAASAEVTDYRLDMGLRWAANMEAACPPRVAAPHKTPLPNLVRKSPIAWIFRADASSRPYPSMPRPEWTWGNTSM